MEKYPLEFPTPPGGKILYLHWHATRIHTKPLFLLIDIFRLCADTYYLVDSGYPNKKGFLAPYKNNTYHIPDFRREGRPSNREELFNYLHSSLRNAVERVFGVLKNKWRILKYIPSYGLVTQKRIILACIALHNFIRDSHLRDKQFDRCDADENYIPKVQRQSVTLAGDTAPSGLHTLDMNSTRD
jgi:hypothetical protein